MSTPTLSQLQRGLAISEQIAALETELAAIFNGAAPVSAPKATPTATPTAKAAPAQGDGRKRKRSAATIAKMKASQQARWAKLKAPVVAKAPAPVKKKGGMSAEGRAAIVAAQKARWAKIKGEKAPAASKAPAMASVIAKAPVKAPAKQTRKPMSPAVKAKLAAAMKARWAAAKSGKGPAPTAKKK